MNWGVQSSFPGVVVRFRGPSQTMYQTRANEIVIPGKKREPESCGDDRSRGYTHLGAFSL